MVSFDEEKISNRDDLKLFYCIDSSISKDPMAVEVKFRYDDVMKAVKAKKDAAN